MTAIANSLELNADFKPIPVSTKGLSTKEKQKVTFPTEREGNHPSLSVGNVTNIVTNVTNIQLADVKQKPRRG